MTTALFIDPVFWQHDTGPGHPECSARLNAIQHALQHPEFQELLIKNAPTATLEQVRLVHTDRMIQRVLNSIPKSGRTALDPDTIVSPNSGQAALQAAGAACAAVDAVFQDQIDNAFCAVRPPGHHAEPDRAMGFCLFNNIAIAARYAQQRYGLGKVAIVDFDVHHGNGTQAAFYEDPSVLYCSLHQSPLYPGTGRRDEKGVGNILNIPLPPGAGSHDIRRAFDDLVIPALHDFEPELLLLSAGFDAHHNDPLASLDFSDADYTWMTEQLVVAAEALCQGRLISFLEGGYHLDSLGRCVANHIRILMESGTCA